MATSIFFQQFASRFKDLRISQGLSQKQLAERAGVSVYIVKACEKRGRCRSVENLSKLADIFGISLHALVFGQEWKR